MLKPFLETGPQPRLHAMDGHVQQMMGRTGAISESASQPTLAFDQKDAPMRLGLGKLECEQAAAETTADDGNRCVAIGPGIRPHQAGSLPRDASDSICAIEVSPVVLARNASAKWRGS